jgi:MarR family transcriptional regulator, organic hydroperoxide resistance regulator
VARRGIDTKDYQTSDTVLYALVQLAKVHRNELAKELAKLDMYIGQEQVLLNLWEPDGVSQAELGVRVQAVPPTLTKMLQRMERSGLVRRRRSDSRGRASWVYLTERGRELRGVVEQLWRRADSRLTSGLSPGELANLRDLLGKLREPDTVSASAPETAGPKDRGGH